MDAHAVHLAMAALVGASVVAVSAYYMHRNTLAQLLEFARTVERDGGSDGDARRTVNGGYRRGSASLPDVTAISGGPDVEENHVEGIPAGLPRLQTLREAPKLVINYPQAPKSSEESLREQLEKAKKKEAAFIVTLAKHEQEIAEFKFAVRDLEAQLKPAAMQNLVEEKDKRVKELQDNIAAVNFTPQSKMGKMLMAKCRTLQEENEEIGNQASEGKMHELATKLSLQKYQNAELISQSEGLQKNMDGLTNDVERSDEVVMLQAKLDEKEQEIQRLKDELELKSFLESRIMIDRPVDGRHEPITLSFQDVIKHIYLYAWRNLPNTV